MTARTMYEVFDSLSGEPVVYKSNGKPVRSSSYTGAILFIAACVDTESLINPCVITTNIPTGAELDVRPVSVEVEP